MKKRHFFLNCTTSSALVAAVFTISTNVGHAQKGEEKWSGDLIEEIVVVAAPIMHRQVERSDASGRSTETITLKRHVSYADLDLGKYEDINELKKRVEINAKEVCEEIDELFPLPRWNRADMRNCVKEAIASANDGLAAAIETAQ